MKIAEDIGVKGRVIVRSHPAGSIAKFEKMIARAGQDRERRREVMAMIRSGKLEAENSNLIMLASNTGKDLLVQWLLGNTTYPVGVNYIAIGTGSTAPAASDTQLTAETARSVISFSADNTFNVAVLQAFLSDSVLANGTYNEAGGFVNGGAGSNSGQLFNHALFASPYVKSSGQDTTVEIDVTFT